MQSIEFFKRNRYMQWMDFVRCPISDRAELNLSFAYTGAENIDSSYKINVK